MAVIFDSTKRGTRCCDVEDKGLVSVANSGKLFTMLLLLVNAFAGTPSDYPN